MAVQVRMEMEVRKGLWINTVLKNPIPHVVVAEGETKRRFRQQVGILLRCVEDTWVLVFITSQ